jgi:hypothetical protein
VRRTLKKSAIAFVSAIGIGAFAAPALRAQAGAAAPNSPQFQTDYAFADAAQCQHSASARCRRKPHAQSPSPGNSAAPPFDIGGPVVRIGGDAAAVRLELRRTTIAEALAALSTFNVSYRSSIMLDEEINGTYSGSLRRVIAHVLGGYNYVIRQDGAALAVDIIGKHGERAIPVPPPVDPFHAGRERRRPQLSGVEHH